LPWGTIVNSTGIYRDTLYYQSGCDSLITTVQLNVQNTLVQNNTVAVCSGQSYILPWGQTVSSSGLYSDTLHYSTGCDSVITNIDFLVRALSFDTNNITICSGSNYVLPWGISVSTPGIYSDTLHYLDGCDSLIKIVNLSVQQPVTSTSSINLCQGSSYTLPWGTIVNSTGIYRDTLYYQSGCDSLITTVQLNVQNTLVQNNAVAICSGQNYILPWGQTVSSSGLYSDTLHYLTGCDSVITNIDLLVRTLSFSNNNVTICSGSNYVLPWGTTVSTPGIYSDTLHYLDGCDSLIKIVNLSVQEPLTSTSSINLCQGSSYTLPWGTMVNSTGIYRDTLHYLTGCDSLIRVVNINVQNKSTTTSSVSICQGQSYTLPWGQAVTQPGTYSNTLFYSSGCDSLVRNVNVEVKTFTTQTINANTCSGLPYVLPWGTLASTSGTYRDTLRYISGCDSLRRVVNLNVTAAATNTSSPRICSDQNYILPWGQVVNRAGIYRDTVKTAFGCDSLVRVINLNVDPTPVISLSKSNDINCILGTATLTATGGTKYEWAPPQSLNNPFGSSTIATPATSTYYSVKVTASNNCSRTDSILVNVDLGNAAAGYLVPSAFTPNGDGKNDCFGIRSWGEVKDLRFHVYNRWGEIVFATTNPSDCWDGRFRGVQQPSAVFVYIISGTTVCGPVLRKGTVTLIR
jgi:gliding motility-associated-like protein